LVLNERISGWSRAAVFAAAVLAAASMPVWSQQQAASAPAQAPAPAPAQAPAPAPSPAVVRRYAPNLADEDWSFLADPKHRIDYLDPIKYILLPRKGWYLSLGGEVRLSPQGMRIRGDEVQPANCR
jgi:hypothetical protein